MAVDWQAFATAFLGDTAKYINERKDKAEEYEQKQRELAERNRGIVAQRQGVVDQVNSLSLQAMNELGATEEMVKAAIDSGPQGIQTLVQQLQEVKTSFGERWTPEAAQAAITLPAGYTSAPNVSLDEYVRRAYGMPAASTGSYEAPRGTWLDRALGRNATDLARERLDQESYAGGYSVYDINEMASQAEYDALVGGAYVNYVAPKVFNRSNIEGELDFLANIITDAQQSPVYNSLAAELARQQAIAESNPTNNEEGVAAAKAEVARIEAEMEDYTTKRVLTAMTDRFGYYTAGGYVEYMAPHIDDLVGVEGFTTSAFQQYQELMGLTEPTTEAPQPNVQTEAPDLAEAAASIEAAGGTAVVEGDTMTVNSPALIDALGSDDGSAIITYGADGQPASVEFTMNGERYIVEGTDDVNEIIKSISAVQEAPAAVTAGGAGFSVPNLPDLAPEDMPLVPRQLISEEDSAAMTREQRRALGIKESPLGRLLEVLPSEEEKQRRIGMLDLKYSADPEQYYLVTIPGRNLNRPYRVRGDALQYIPDQVLARGYDNAEIATMDTIEGTGRPPRIMTADQLLSIYNPADFDPEVANALSEEEIAQGRQAVEEIRNPAPAEPVEVDEMTQSLIENQGGVMINYLKDQGLDENSSPEELTIALMNFQQETGTQLPFNKNALVQLLTQAMAEGV